MNGKKSSLMNNKNNQGFIFKLLFCLTITFLILTSMSFYNEIVGQKTNSSILPNNYTNTIKNSNFALQKSNESIVGKNNDYSSSLPDLFDHVQKSVVQITDSADLQQQGSIAATRLGSGFVYDHNGDIVTNYHVVVGAKNNTIVVTFMDGVSYEANIMGVDPYSDLAVIKLVNLHEHSDAISKLVPLELA